MGKAFLSSELALTPSEAIVHYNALIEAGIQYLIIAIWPHDLDTLQMFSERVIPGIVRC